MAKKKKASVEKFKQFVQDHPNVRLEVKSGKFTWQELFEEWYLLGEDHERWNDYDAGITKVESSEATAPDMVGSLINTVKALDINQIQQYITNASQALGAIQGIISSFQGDKSSEEPKKPEVRSNPFKFRKD